MACPPEWAGRPSTQKPARDPARGAVSRANLNTIPATPHNRNALPIAATRYHTTARLMAIPDVYHLAREQRLGFVSRMDEGIFRRFRPAGARPRTEDRAEQQQADQGGCQI